MNTPPTHPELVAALVKPGQAIIDSLTPQKAHLWYMASCIPGEAGELFDAIKKFVIYEKELDRENVVEELGDLEFYMEGLRFALGITRQETLGHNVEKLSKRYAGLSYSNKAAVDRADKAEWTENPDHATAEGHFPGLEAHVKNLEAAIINLRSLHWFTNEHANRLRQIKGLDLGKLKGIKYEESFNRMFNPHKVSDREWAAQPAGDRETQS